MGHGITGALIPLAEENRPPGESLKGGRADKAGGRFGHDHVDGMTCLDQQAHQFAGFVSGYAARDANKKVSLHEIKRPCCIFGRECSSLPVHPATRYAGRFSG